MHLPPFQIIAVCSNFLCALIIYCCVTNYHKLSSLKQHIFIIAHLLRPGVWARLSLWWAGSGRGDGGLISLDSDFYGMKPFCIAPQNAPPSSPSAISCISKSQLFLDLLVELAQCLSTFHSTVLVGHTAYISSCSSISLLSSKYLLKSFTCSYAIVWVSQEADFKVILSVQGFY